MRSAFYRLAIKQGPKKIDWKIVVTGLSLQILLAFGMLYIPALQIFFEFLGKIFVKILEFISEVLDEEKTVAYVDGKTYKVSDVKNNDVPGLHLSLIHI